MKGQMPLQIIIGVLILLVVFFVTIRFFILKMSSTRQEKEINEMTWDLKFKAECERLCNEYKTTGENSDLAKFCYTQPTEKIDLNRNGKIDSIKATTKILDICEDAVYCFHLYPCDIGSKTLEWADCRKAVCDYLIETNNGDENAANIKTKEIFKSGGSCGIPKEESWWEMYFGDEPCSNPPHSLFMKNCFYEKNKQQIICETNCQYSTKGKTAFSVSYGTVFCKAELKPDGSTPSPEESIKFEKDKIIVKTNPSLSLLDLTSIENWEIVLFCNKPVGDFILFGAKQV